MTDGAHPVEVPPVEVPPVEVHDDIDAGSDAGSDAEADHDDTMHPTATDASKVVIPDFVYEPVPVPDIPICRTLNMKQACMDLADGVVRLISANGNAFDIPENVALQSRFIAMLLNVNRQPEYNIPEEYRRIIDFKYYWISPTAISIVCRYLSDKMNGKDRITLDSTPPLYEHLYLNAWASGKYIMRDDLNVWTPVDYVLTRIGYIVPVGVPLTSFSRKDDIDIDRSTIGVNSKEMNIEIARLLREVFGIDGVPDDPIVVLPEFLALEKENGLLMVKPEGISDALDELIAPPPPLPPPPRASAGADAGAGAGAPPTDDDIDMKPQPKALTVANIDELRALTMKRMPIAFNKRYIWNTSTYVSRQFDIDRASVGVEQGYMRLVLYWDVVYDVEKVILKASRFITSYCGVSDSIRHSDDLHSTVDPEGVVISPEHSMSHIIDFASMSEVSAGAMVICLRYLAYKSAHQVILDQIKEGHLPKWYIGTKTDLIRWRIQPEVVEVAGAGAGGAGAPAGAGGAGEGAEGTYVPTVPEIKSKIFEKLAVAKEFSDRMVSILSLSSRLEI